MKRVPARNAVVVVMAALHFLAPGAARAQSEPGGLLVAPTRVVFEGNLRSAALTLINTGSETATYRITFVQMDMTAAGQIVRIPDDSAGTFRSDNLIRYSPRQVTLKPHTPQTVRLQLRLPADLPDGEYRSHLLFRAIPDVTPPEDQAEPPSPPDGEVTPVSLAPAAPSPAARVAPSRRGRGAGKSGGPVTIQLTSVFGVAIPVIVRHGDTKAAAALTALRLSPPRSAAECGVLSLQIDRSGNRSVYGSLVVTHVDGKGREQIVGRVDGLAVYTSTPTRHVEIPLKPAGGRVPQNGLLRVTYAPAGKGDDSPITAEIRLD